MISGRAAPALSNCLPVRRGVDMGPHVECQPGPEGFETLGSAYGLAAFGGEAFQCLAGGIPPKYLTQAVH